MSTYREIVGKKIKKVSADPSSGTEGEMWYNSTTGKLRGLQTLEAWSSGSPLSTARFYTAGFGTQTSAICAGGSVPPVTNVTEEYDGSGWTAGGNIGTTRYNSGGAGTTPAGLIFGGYSSPNVYANTEEYDGSSWTAGNVMNQARYKMGQAGTQTAAAGFGGFKGGSPPATTNTEEYDGTNWTAGNVLPSEVAQNSGAGTQTAAISIGGRTGPSSTALTTVNEYDGTNWTAGTATPSGRKNGAAYGLQTSAMFIGGGGTLTKAIKYDGTTWSNAPDLATGREHLSAAGASIPSGLGFAGYNPPAAGYAVTEEFNNSTTAYTAGAWASGGNLNTGRINVSMGGTQTAGIVLGGHISPGGEPKAVETYNGSAFTSVTAIGPYSGDYAAYAGSSTAGIIFGGAPYTTNTAEYNGSWTGGGALSTGRSQLMGAGTGETSAVAIGGFTDSTTSTTATEEYGGTSWTGGGAMSTQRGRGAGFGIETAALVVGGNTSPDTAVTANSEEYGGTSWTAGGSIFTATGSYIGGFGTQTDGAIVGGANPSYVATTLGYDGTTWSTRPNAAYAAGRTQTAGANGSAGLRAGGGPNTSQRDGSEEFTGETSAANIKNFTTS